MVRPQTATDHCDTIRDALARIHSLKTGDSRAMLEENFELDGGLQFPGKSVYVFKKCNFIKINVEFTAEAQQTDLLAADKISKISRPYLEYPFRD